MNLTSPSEVKAWCLAHDFHPNKVLGQNFLIDRNQLCAIVDAAQLPPEGARVLEIGPGLGVLTEELLARGATLTVIEKDPVLAARLDESLHYPPRLTVLAGDALDLIAQGTCDGFDFLVSNLPYQAGTRILLELVTRIAPPTLACAPETMVVLVQTEVAQRLASREGSKMRGLAGVWMQLDYDVACVRTVPPTCFWPRPEIGSTVVRLVRHHRHDALSSEHRTRFHALTKKAFEHRRKQLGSTFKKDALPFGEIPLTARAEELTLSSWLQLTEPPLP